MKKISLILSIIITLTILSGCSSEEKEKLYILNWGEYLDLELVSEFEKEFNVKVIYEEVESNETMYTKISNKTTNYDIAFPSEYMIEKLKNEDMLYKIDTNIIENYDLIDQKYYDIVDFDEASEYFVPYFTGSVGILYNKNLVSESDLDGWNTLWNSKFKNQVYLYDSIRDTLMVAAFKNGFSVNTDNSDELAKIEEDLSALNDLARGYGTDDLKNLVAAGDGALAVVYSGDYLVTYVDQMETSGEVNVEYYVPSEGTNIWVDGMVIPNTSQNQELANQFINFMLEYDNAKQNAEYVGYTTTHKDVFTDLVNSGEEIYSTTAYVLPEATFNNSEVFKNLDQTLLGLYSDIFIRIKN